MLAAEHSSHRLATQRELGDRDSLFEGRLLAILPASRIITDALRRVALGADASFYRLAPKLVVLVETEEEVRQVIECASELGVSLTFRAAGTSLSGQAVTDSVLVKLGHNGWRNWLVGSNASTVRCGPALTGAQINRRLARHGRKIGPDPASINSAMIGGIAANNASGMCCGIDQNSYRTLESIRVILVDGTVLDTSDTTSRMLFQQSHAGFLSELGEMGRATRADATLSERIARKYAIKNTMGYSLNALVDYEDPFDILAHLMIGSEGTLGFISEITYRTVPDPRHKANALAFFPDIRSACDAVARLKTAPVSAVELMDYRALCSVRGKSGMPALLDTMPVGTAALLIEVQGISADEASASAEAALAAFAPIDTLEPATFSVDPKIGAAYWKIRKGLFPAVGAVREVGTTVIIEDVAVTTDKLADAVIDLVALFEKHRYDEAIVFGHALEGNVHFVFTQGFATSEEIARYGAFMDDVADLIVNKYDGSLKAEHSTGRNMAPFVEMEWGADAYRLMRRIKNLFDPRGILNPGVILNDDKRVHIANLKPMPAAHEIVDKCIECGFCETTCPSRALTLTPRQRIVGLREMARLGLEGRRSKAVVEAMAADFAYQGVDSCAGDGLCSLECPVGIDTGEAMRVMRQRRHGRLAHFISRRVARNFGIVAGGIRVGLLGMGLARHLVGDSLLSKMFGALNRVSRGLVPIWLASMPTAAPPPAHRAERIGDRIVYFASCATRVFGPSPHDSDQATVPDKVQNLLAKAGYSVVLPRSLEKLCCGMPFNSKGYLDVAQEKLDELATALWAASRDGKDPIVFDTSPCALRAKQVALKSGLKVYDMIEAIDCLVLDRVETTLSNETIAVHTTCSARRMGLEPAMQRVAQRLAKDIVVPPDIQCCGFAGDKGFNVPELNASALRNLKVTLPEHCTRGYSTSRTCEIGLSEHSGRSYQSIAYLVDSCTQAKRVVED
jgi:D-lactate dehydrogenase